MNSVEFKAGNVVHLIDKFRASYSTEYLLIQDNSIDSIHVRSSYTIEYKEEVHL